MAIKKAIALLSGGLDSILAVRLVQGQGIKVTGLSFKTPFFNASKAQKAASMLNIPLVIQDITKEYLKMLKTPRYGYGSGMNPCNDCHALMIKKAGDLMKKKGFDFIFTGEVVGERPFSQNLASLNAVANLSGYKEYLLRPLSAKLLAPSRPEKTGIIGRAKLLDIQGRSRKRQIELARAYGIAAYETPAGGCLLTDKNFSNRLKDLLRHDKEPAVRQYHLLRYGRHMRLGENAKLIVGRNKQDNDLLQQHCTAKEVLVFCVDIPGPLCALTGTRLKDLVDLACRVCAAYSDAQDSQQVELLVKSGRKEYFKTVAADKSLKQQVKWI